MTKLIYLFAFICLSFTASAQYDPEALDVLNAMSAKYQKMKAFTAEFSQEMINESANLNETISGEITIKDDMYVLKVAGQEIYNNGEVVFSFNPEIAEVTVDTYMPEEQEISLSNIYDLYREGFKYALMSINKAGDRIIELDPESKDKSYYKIRMIIDKNDSLEKFIVFERSGNEYVYTIKGIEEQPDLKDAYFTFDPEKYPNVEVIDFR